MQNPIDLPALPKADASLGAGLLLDPLPRLHPEPDIVAPADNEAAAWRPALLNRLLAARTPAARRQLVRQLIDGLGFDSLVTGRYRRQDQRWVPRSFCTTYADMGWLQRYVCASYHRVDPRIARALQCNLPCTWSIEVLQHHCDGASSAWSLEQAFVDDLRATGLRSGAILALPERMGWAHHGADECFQIGLASRREGTAWLDDALVGQVFTLGMCLHELYDRYLREPEAARVDLPAQPISATQRRILDGVARGLCDKKIASELGLSSYNVDYHLRRLRQRFGVHNRVQLARVAMEAEPIGLSGS